MERDSIYNCCLLLFRQFSDFTIPSNRSTYLLEHSFLHIITYQYLIITFDFSFFSLMMITKVTSFILCFSSMIESLQAFSYRNPIQQDKSISIFILIVTIFQQTKYISITFAFYFFFWLIFLW